MPDFIHPPTDVEIRFSTPAMPQGAMGGAGLAVRLCAGDARDALTDAAPERASAQRGLLG